MGSHLIISKWIALVVLLCTFTPSTAHGTSAERDAASAPWEATPSNDLASYYDVPVERAYWRVAALEASVLAGGLTWYYANSKLNSKDWEYGYTWTAFEAKLTGEAYSFDDNRFDTNFLSHPGAGSLYYLSARSSHFNVGESMLITFGMSALWEYLAEFREYVSINDMFTTPFGGVALGESVFQLGALFDRGCGTMTNRVLGSIFGPLVTAGNAIEGSRVSRPRVCDRLGLPRWGGRRIELAAGAVVARRFGRTSSADSALLTIDARTEIVNLRRYGRAGRGWTSFGDGNVSWLSAGGSFDTDNLDQLWFGAKSVLAGLHQRVPYEDGRLNRELLLGVGLGTEYSRKRYGTASLRPEPFFVVDLPMLWARVRSHFSTHTLELDLAAGATTGGARSLAIDEFVRAGRSRSELPTVTEHHGYYHLLGVALAPSVRWIGNYVGLGVEARFDRAAGIRALDHGGADSDVRSEEIRRRARLWADFGSGIGPKLRVSSEWFQRASQLDDTVVRRSELRAGSSLLLDL